MRDKLNKFTENLIRLAALERAHQLEEMSHDISVLEKQEDLLQLADEIILRANKAPQGLVEIVFTDKRVRDGMKPDEIMRNLVCKISGFNVADPESIKSPFRTVIVVDSRWSDNLRVFQSELGLPNKFLK